MSTEQYCCFVDPAYSGLPCKNKPEWEIWYEAPEGNTVSCNRHVMELLTDAPVHTLHALGEESARFTIVACDLAANIRLDLAGLVAQAKRGHKKRKFWKPMKNSESAV